MAAFFAMLLLSLAQGQCSDAFRTILESKGFPLGRHTPAQAEAHPSSWPMRLLMQSRRRLSAGRFVLFDGNGGDLELAVGGATSKTSCISAMFKGQTFPSKKALARKYGIYSIVE